MLKIGGRAGVRRIRSRAVIAPLACVVFGAVAAAPAQATKDVRVTLYNHTDKTLMFYAGWLGMRCCSNGYQYRPHLVRSGTLRPGATDTVEGSVHEYDGNRLFFEVNTGQGEGNDHCGSFWFTNSFWFPPGVWSGYLDGPDRWRIGTDFPYEDPGEVRIIHSVHGIYRIERLRDDSHKNFSMTATHCS